MPPSTRPLWQRFLIFLLPLMLANILQSLSGTINNIFIGQLIGVEALAAASVFFPILFFLMSFVIGLSSGSTVLVGQAWGAHNVDKVKQVAGTTITAAFLFGVVVALFGGFFADALMHLLGAPPDILAAASGYARIFLIGMPAFFLFLIVTSILRGVGDTITPLVSLGISIATGLIVTPALILGWGGLPRLGVNAAAVGGIASFVDVLIFLFFYLRWRKHPMAPDRALLKHLRIDPQMLLLILKLGVPAGVQMVVISVSAIVVVGLVNGFGSDATAAYGATNQVLSYVQFPAMSIAIATSIFGAQAIGAGQASQLGAITRVGEVMNLILTGTLMKGYVHDVFWNVAWLLGFDTPLFPYAYRAGAKRFLSEFGTYEFVTRQFEESLHEGRAKLLPEVSNLNRFWRLMASFAVRRRKDEVFELPAKQRTIRM